jgi:DNA polymerase-1
MNTLLIIDGNAIMHRAFHAIPAFKTTSGKPTNVIYGFFSMLQKAIQDFHPTHIVVCFDTPKPTFRNKLYKKYQENRPKISDDFISQIPLVREGLKAAEITYLEKDGYEADDVIGTLAIHAKKHHLHSLILTGDKDILQLVNDMVMVISPKLGISNIQLLNKDDVVKKLGIPPEKITDFKALMGDPSDNYPGAKGIGPKTAAELLETYNSIDHIYKHLEDLKPKVKDLLIKHKENVFLSKQLATIHTDVPIHINFEKTHFQSFNMKLKDFLLSLEMKTLAQRLFSDKMKINKKNVQKKSEEQISMF